MSPTNSVKLFAASTNFIEVVCESHELCKVVCEFIELCKVFWWLLQHKNWILKVLHYYYYYYYYYYLWFYNYSFTKCWIKNDYKKFVLILYLFLDVTIKIEIGKFFVKMCQNFLLNILSCVLYLCHKCSPPNY